MSDGAFPPILRAALAQLTQQPQALAWPDRQQVAIDLARFFAEVGPTEPAITLATILAHDERPEVRKEIADLLGHMPDEEFIALAGHLKQDVNAYVRTSVMKVISRRNKAAKREQQTRRAIGKVQSSYAAMEKEHGSLAAQKARRLADELFETLVHATLHDLRNIVSPIGMTTSSLIKQHANGQPHLPTCIELLDDMRRQLEYLNRFMAEMRNYADGSRAERVRCRIEDLVNEAITMTRASLESHPKVSMSTVDLQLHVPAHLSAPVIRHQIVMVLIHVIKNAVESFDLTSRKHPGPREVRISAEELPEGMVAITIRDTGIGMSVATLETIREFSPGHSTKLRYGGTGFGLPTANRYILGHGGVIRIDSTQGKGTEVFFTLPCEDDDLSGPVPESPTPDAEGEA